MLRVALTGGIASGKSAAATMFRALGVPVIDTDEIARDVVAPGRTGLAALAEHFGQEILDPQGGLDRARLRKIIFSDDAARQRVNALLHPLILDEVNRQLRAMDAPYAVVEIPLLVETGLAPGFDRVLVIDAPDELRVARVMERDAVSKAQAQAALSAQATRAERLALATDVVENTGTLTELQHEIQRLHERYLVEAKRFASAPERPAE